MLAVVAGRRDHPIVGVGDAVMSELPRYAHRGAEVVGADQQRVDPLDRGDLVRGLHGLGRLDHYHGERRAVDEARGLARRQRLVFELRHAPGHRPPADRRIEAIVAHGLGLGGAVDMRHDDALRAGVQQPGRMEMLMRRGARDRRNAGIQRRRADLRRRVDGERAMLQVHEQPVIAADRSNLGNLRHAGETQAEAQRKLPGSELLLGAVGDQGHAVQLLPVWLPLGTKRRRRPIPPMPCTRSGGAGMLPGSERSAVW